MDFRGRRWKFNRPVEGVEDVGGRGKTRSAEGGTRTPTPFRAQRPERCVSTNFTTSADALSFPWDEPYITASLPSCQEVFWHWLGFSFPLAYLHASFVRSETFPFVL